MKKKYILTVSAVAIVLLAGAVTYKVYAERNNGLAAVVNGEKITISDVRQTYDANPQFQAQVPFEEFYGRALEVMINSKLALQAATAANIQATPEYQKQLAAAQEEIARQMYIEREVLKKITDERVQQIYDQYVKNFKSEKEVKAKHILVNNEKLAKEIIFKLNKKRATFDALAKKYSKDQSDLGYFTANMMVPEFSKAAMAMKKGTYSQKPVKTEFGYHIIYVEDIRETKPLPLADVEEKIKTNLAQQGVSEVVKELRDAATIEKYDLEGKKIEETKEPAK
ncbi:MAG: peptidyl-prolyl cis-trans isomerase [Alphaproteobacteria bacterium]|nr:peptidyl-prolyl cis-trans isomerase [Alphaproteobacteria bacterium]